MARSTKYQGVRRVFRVVAIAALAAGAAVPLFWAYLAIRSGGSKVFEPVAFDYALLAMAAFGIALGAQLAPWRTYRYATLLAMFGSGFLLFAIVGAFGIGLAFVPAAVVLMVLLFRALRRTPPTVGRAAALGGAAIGYGVVLLYIALVVPATAECFPNGAGTSSGRWRTSAQMISSSGGGGIGGKDGVFTGRSEYADSVVTFRCEGGRMVEFQRIAR